MWGTKRWLLCVQKLFTFHHHRLWWYRWQSEIVKIISFSNKSRSTINKDFCWNKNFSLHNLFLHERTVFCSGLLCRIQIWHDLRFYKPCQHMHSLRQNCTFNTTNIIRGYLTVTNKIPRYRDSNVGVKYSVYTEKLYIFVGLKFRGFGKSHYFVGTWGRGLRVSQISSC